jgi:NitT/TauT family transport system substrate-binding protein
MRYRRAFALLVFLACGAATPARAATAIVFGITSGTALSLAHYISTEKGFYAAEGVAVDTIVAGAAAGVLQQLAAGSLNIAQAATDQSLRAIVRGAPVKIIAGAASNAPFRLIAAKRIKNWSDLKGKTVSVGGPTDVTLYFLRIMAGRNGLGDRDYDVLYGGGTPSRFAQLAAGAVSAAMLTNPVDFAALERGFVELGSVSQYLPNWTQNNILVNTRWAQTNRPAVLAFVRAHIRAIEYFYDPDNRSEVIGILAKHTRTTPAIAEATYDLYMRQQVIAREAALDEDGIKANLDALVAIGDLREAPPASRFIDATFLQAVKPGYR